MDLGERDTPLDILDSKYDFNDKLSMVAPLSTWVNWVRWQTRDVILDLGNLAKLFDLGDPG